MELQHRQRAARIKIVYYGPAVGGKTTNLQVLHDAALGEHRGDLVSIVSAQDRTILFDLLPLKGTGLHGFEVRFQVLAVPGQAAYAATRRMSLRGADAVVFVANSAADRFHENSLSFRELTEGLIAHGLDPASIPLVFQYNKRDLPQTSAIEELEGALNFRRAPHFKAVAFRGEGVLETLEAVVEQTMADLTSRYRTLALAPGETAQGWTKEALGRIFGGRTTLTAAATPPAAGAAADLRAAAPLEYAPWKPTLDVSAAAPPARRIVRVALAGEAGGGAAHRADTRPEDALIDSYARASVALGQSLDEVREQRDDARRWLGDVELAFGAIEALASGKATAEGLKPLLGRILTTAGSRRASLLVPGPGGAPRRLAGAGLEGDPLLVSRAGRRLLAHQVGTLEAPQLLAVEESEDLREAVVSTTPAVTSLLVMPLRSGARFHGVVLLYYGSSDPLPGEDVLTHLERLARALASGFTLSRLRSEGAQAQRPPAGAAHGELARRALPELERVLEAVNQQLRGALQRPPSGGPGLDPAAEALANALGLARAARAPDKYARTGQSVAVDALFARLPAGSARTQPAPGLRVAGHPALLRIAVEALVELAAGSSGPSPAVRAALEQGQVQIAAVAGAPGQSLPAGDLRVALVSLLANLHGGTLHVGLDSGHPLYQLSLPRA